MVSGKSLQPEKTGEIMSLHLQRAEQNPTKLICLFNFGLFSVQIPREGSELKIGNELGKFKFDQEE